MSCLLSLLKSPQGRERLVIFASQPYRHGHGGLRSKERFRTPASLPFRSLGYRMYGTTCSTYGFVFFFPKMLFQLFL